MSSGRQIKFCADCKQTLDLSAFCKNKANRSGIADYCKICHYARNKEWKLEGSKKPLCVVCDSACVVRHKYCDSCKPRKTKRKVAERSSYQQSRALLFGAPRNWFESAFAKQNGCCAICLSRFTKTGSLRPVMDHDHGSNELRALLCLRCNTGIGMLGDSIERLDSAIAYLKSFSHPTDEETNSTTLELLNQKDNCHSVVN